MVNLQDIVDPQIVADMMQKRAWIPLGALAIATVVRLLKTDIRFFPDVPPRARIWVCFALGQVAGMLESVIAGKTYKEAIVWGLTQSVMAVMGQEMFIASLRGGKEIAVPGLPKTNVAPSPGKPVSISAPAAEIPVIVTEDTSAKAENKSEKTD